MTMKRNPIGSSLLLLLLVLIAPSLPTHFLDTAERTGSFLDAFPQALQEPAYTQKSPPPDQTAVIRVSSNLIAVTVSVTNGNGQPVTNLSIRDFTIEEDGKLQSIAQLGEPGETPVELALLFDISGSTRPRFEFEQEAASKFLREVIRPSDTVSIFTIGSDPKLVQERTVDVNAAVQELRQVQPTQGATAFYDTVVKAAQHVQKTAAPGTRRVLIVVSDGEDNYSDPNGISDALREIQRADCLFYSLNPSGTSIRLNKISLKGQEAMETLASQSGGAAFLPDKLGELTAIFARITNELRAQYLLGYYASEQRRDGKFRRITVRIPNRPDLRVRARQGYYSAANS